MKETTVDLRRAAGKREAIKLIYKAIGFDGEAGTNLDALADVLSAWGMPVRIRMLYWKSFCDREPVRNFWARCCWYCSAAEARSPSTLCSGLSRTAACMCTSRWPSVWRW